MHSPGHTIQQCNLQDAFTNAATAKLQPPQGSRDYREAPQSGEHSCKLPCAKHSDFIYPVLLITQLQIIFAVSRNCQAAGVG